MCGIAGLMMPGGSQAWLADRVASMTAALTHRGPDEQGTWTDSGAGLALGHTRLSIIDLSPTGRQPMVSASGRYVIVFNGEIYNFQEMRVALLAEGAVLRGRSDTEVLLAAIDSWGIDKSMHRSAGMFAFGLWDRIDRCLTLVRDRCGEKPLYYGQVGAVLAFGSELKSFRALPGWPNPIDPTGLALFFRHGCIPSPHTIHTGIQKLAPGELIQFNHRAELTRRTRYWNYSDVARQRREELSDQEAIDELDRLLRASVHRCMISDVPLGAFLSGGLDSAAVVSLMQAQSTVPVNTFTIGFRESGYDEAGLARSIARHLGTRHTEVYVSPEDALAVVPSLPTIYDEPFADSSQIPTYLVSKVARRDVVVSLSGDGGDELFGGYNRHTWGADLWRNAARFPLPLRRVFGAALTAVPGSSWDRLILALGAVLPRRLRPFSPGDRIHKLAGLFAAQDADDLYRRMVTHWAVAPVSGAADAMTPDAWPLATIPGAGLAERMMLSDLGGYLPDDVLVKLDRASMAVSLEARAPFLDHELVEFAWRLPEQLKIRSGQGKWILRQLLARYLPKSLFERPKMGFAIPVDAWLRNPLRDWAEAMLDPSRLGSHGLLDTEAIRRCWHEHVIEGRQRQAQLWDVLMFQAWYEESFR